jgi:hypothetical protein
MTKHDTDIAPKAVAKAKEPPVTSTNSPCVVCGGWDGLEEPRGQARWHKACEAARPDVIAKVKARA